MGSTSSLTAPADVSIRPAPPPDLVAEFIAEYTVEWNCLWRGHQAEAGQRDRKLADVERKIAGVLDAIERGITTASTKERLAALEIEKAGLEITVVEPVRPAFQPNLAKRYRDKVAPLYVELRDPQLSAEAKSVLQSMIMTINIYPGAKRGEVARKPHGAAGHGSRCCPGQKQRRDARVPNSSVGGCGGSQPTPCDGYLASICGVNIPANIAICKTCTNQLLLKWQFERDGHERRS